MTETVTEYELPPVTFAECRALLNETTFFTMRSVRPYPFNGFNGSSTRVTVKANHIGYSVSVASDAEPPAGFERIYSFAAGMEKRGKPVKPGAAGRGEGEKP